MWWCLVDGVGLPKFLEGPVAWLSGVGPALLGVAVVVGFVLVLVFLSVGYVVRGGGQYGIIEGYVGTIGAGKTSLAVQHALSLARARDALLLSNIGVVCGPGCKADPPVHLVRHALIPLTIEGLDLKELMRRAFEARAEGRGLVLLMDEVGIIMPSRLWKQFPVSLMWMLQQSRRVACEWVWTAQDATFVDVQLRKLTAVVHHVRSYPPPSIWRRVKGKRPWVLVASAYLPMAAPAANGEGGARIADKRLGRRLLRYSRKWEAAFDTDEIVLPPEIFAGAAELAAAVREGIASGGLHVNVSATDWGAAGEGAEEPE